MTECNIQLFTAQTRRSTACYRGKKKLTVAVRVRNEKRAGICGDPYQCGPSLSVMHAPTRLGYRLEVLSCRGLPPVHPREDILKSPAHPYTEEKRSLFRASQDYRRTPSGWPASRTVTFRYPRVTENRLPTSGAAGFEPGSAAVGLRRRQRRTRTEPEMRQRQFKAE